MTGGQIEDFILQRIMSLFPPVSGGVYLRNNRPIQNEQPDLAKEDIVIALISGTEDQIQRGSCVVNLYVPDILTASGIYYRDKSRTDMLEKWLVSIPAALSRCSDIVFQASGMIMTLKSEDIHQHFISLKMDFRVLNENY